MQLWSKHLNCSKLNTADYIKSPNLTTREKELLFKLRSRTIDVKQNFPGQYGPPWCRSCGLFQETQGHLLQCPEIVVKLRYVTQNFSKIDENFVYGNNQQQHMICKIYSEILDVRENLKEDQFPSSGGPTAPSLV